MSFSKCFYFSAIFFLVGSSTFSTTKKSLEVCEFFRRQHSQKDSSLTARRLKVLLMEVIQTVSGFCFYHCPNSLETFTFGCGYFNFILSNVLTMVWATAQLRNHFKFAGITYHGAHLVLHLLRASS